MLQHKTLKDIGSIITINNLMEKFKTVNFQL